MFTEDVRVVRRFHRLVAQRAGVLEERFLGRDRPLGASRLLFEISAEGASLRDLRARLGLDSGYLTRLTQSLVAEGLAELDVDPQDERVRSVRLTEAGLAELREIDRRSDEVAVGLLATLTAAQRIRLVDAMEEVHRLYSLATLVIEPADPNGAEARWCLARYYEELASRFESGFDAANSTVADPSAFSPPHGLFLVGTIDGRPVACGALKLMGGGVAYLKRMWVDGSARGLGLGRRLLAALERASADLGCGVIQLETNRALSEAIALYRSAGYREVAPFNDEVYAHHWFEKRLDGA